MGRRGYPPEFRRKVLDLIEAGRKVADVAHDLGISDQAPPRSRKSKNFSFCSLLYFRPAINPTATSVLRRLLESKPARARSTARLFSMSSPWTSLDDVEREQRLGVAALTTRTVLEVEVGAPCLFLAGAAGSRPAPSASSSRRPIPANAVEPIPLCRNRYFRQGRWNRGGRRWVFVVDCG
jgi:hypothetical protein